ncbi:hypothetical protein PINS_up003580 [Pythium insidiosum]|nr:hypothetical protein PINS_up003580 [Pythium insidiosum]
MQRKVVLLEESAMANLTEAQQLRPESPLEPADLREPMEERANDKPEQTEDDSQSSAHSDDQDVRLVLPSTPGATAIAPPRRARVRSPLRRNPRAVATEPSAQARECHICFEKVAVDKAQLCDECSGFFCPSCFRWYIEYKIQEGEVSERKMVCPAPQCTRPLGEEAVASFVAPESLVKYYQFLENQRPGIRFCPRPGCCAKIDEPAFSTSRLIKCSTCDRESCAKCGKDYHKVGLCRRSEPRYGKWKRHHDVRSCPSCKSDIEKRGGCPHMKCFHCDHEFCWLCRRAWATHGETLCLPLAFLRSKNRKLGSSAPMRAVTKSVVISAGVVVVVAGVGIAVVAVPSILVYHWAKDSLRRAKKSGPPHPPVQQLHNEPIPLQAIPR